MLYLNKVEWVWQLWCEHLTLTSVVFEYSKAPISLSKPFYLTLTSVVFELKKPPKFDIIFTDLTLTSVVFEFHSYKFY